MEVNPEVHNFLTKKPYYTGFIGKKQIRQYKLNVNKSLLILEPLFQKIQPLFINSILLLFAGYREKIRGIFIFRFTKKN